MSTIEPSREFGEEDPRPWAEAFKKEKEPTPEEILDATANRIIGQMEFGSDGKAKKRRRRPNDPKRKMPPLKALPLLPKFTFRAELFAVHKKKERQRYMALVNSGNCHNPIRSVQWGVMGRCWVFLEWSEKVQDATAK